MCRLVTVTGINLVAAVVVARLEHRSTMVSNGTAAGVRQSRVTWRDTNGPFISYLWSHFWSVSFSGLLGGRWATVTGIEIMMEEERKTDTKEKKEHNTEWMTITGEER